MKETENLKDDIEVKNNLITIYSEKIKDNEKKYLMNRKQHLESMKSNEESITVLREELVQLRDGKNNTEVITKKISKTVHEKENELSNLRNHIEKLSNEINEREEYRLKSSKEIQFKKLRK